MEGVSAQISINDAASAVFENIATASDMATKSINEFQSAMQGSYSTNTMQGVSSDIATASNNQNSFNEELREGGSLASQLADKVKSVVGAYLGWQAVKKTISASDEFSNTIARLNLVDVKSGSAIQMYQEIYTSAQRARMPVNELAGAVSKLGLLAGDKFSSGSELINFSETLAKSFKVSGATAQESAAAMHQISQALASNRLQGDEFVSVLENAPMFARAIQEELDGIDMKKASAEGLITADVMKRAAFNMAEEVNRKLAEMPRTFMGNLVLVVNNAIMGLAPLFDALSRLWNSDLIIAMIDATSIAFQGLGAIGAFVIDLLTTGLDFVANNAWLLIPPLVALGVHLAINGGLMLWGIAVSLAKAAADVAATVAIFGLIVAQEGLNAALAACPIVWIIVAIILVVLAVLKLIQWLLSLAGVSVSVVGMIGAVFGFLGTHLFNIFKAIANIVFAVAEFIANVFNHPIYSVMRLFANLAKTALGMARSMTSSFDGTATNLANAFIDGANRAIRAINWVIRALNKIPGVNLSEMGQFAHTASITNSIKKAEDGIDKWLEASKPDDYVEIKPFEMTDTFDGAMAGMEMADSMMNKLKNKFKPDDSGEDKQKDELDKILKELEENKPENMGAPGGGGGSGGGGGKAPSSLSKPLRDTAINTKKIAENTDTSKLDVRYLREIAERQAINRFTTATINIENNLKHSVQEGDLDGFVDKLSDKLQTELEVQVDGYYKH